MTRLFFSSDYAAAAARKLFRFELASVQAMNYMMNEICLPRLM